MTKSFVADFTTEQLQNASAGRRYGQRKREAQQEAVVSETERRRFAMFYEYPELANEIGGLRAKLADAEALAEKWFNRSRLAWEQATLSPDEIDMLRACAKELVAIVKDSK